MSSVFPRSLGADLPVVERAEGAVMWDADGREYLDAAGGAVVVGIGHGDQRVVEALAAQESRVAYAHPTRFTSEALESYAQEVATVLPVDEARVYPVSGGSEAVETALKMARAFHLANGEEGRHKVIARAGSYHGNTRGALDASGRSSLRRPYEAWLGHTLRVPAVYEYRCPLETHDNDCGARHAERLDDLIRREGPDTIACFVAEPVVGAALGAVPPPEDYWSNVAEVCRDHGVLLVADEVMTGFGRTGEWFACDHWSLRPDIVVAGKGASSGYWPFGFAACSRALFEAIEPEGFVHGFTFSHSVAGCAAAGAVLRVLKEDSLVGASRERGRLLLQQLTGALEDHPNVGDVRGLGLLAGVELVRDRATKEPFTRRERLTEAVIAAAELRGTLLYPATGGADGTNGDVLLLGPPFVITEEQIDRVAATVRDALDAVVS